MKISEALKIAKGKLTEKTFHKGSYFAARNNVLCMCSHGAVQIVVNPACQEAAGKYGLTPLGVLDAVAGVAGAAGVAAEVEVGNMLREPTLAKLSLVWSHRPEWVKEDSSRGNLDAHFLLGMVGLTTAFNDRSVTTLDDVHTKFDEAIRLAESLGV